jgi:hypothetical protein
LTSLDTEKRLQDTGANVHTASIQQALGLVDRHDLSAGVLDFDLGNADSTAVCWKLYDRRIPFVFYTGPD